MTWEIQFLFALVALASALFASGRVRLDIVALLVILALALSGILTPREAFSGFGDPVVILVAGLLVVGEMLTRTGIAFSIGQWLIRVGGDGEVRLMGLLMLASALMGSVMSSTAIVAILLPVVLNISGKKGIDQCSSPDPHLVDHHARDPLGVSHVATTAENVNSRTAARRLSNYFKGE